VTISDRSAVLRPNLVRSVATRMLPGCRCSRQSYHRCRACVAPEACSMKTLMAPAPTRASTCASRDWPRVLTRA
jgi:hypothetical protein